MIVEHASKTCPTCAGSGDRYPKGQVIRPIPLPCPDCTDGRVPVPTTETHLGLPASWAEWKIGDWVRWDGTLWVVFAVISDTDVDDDPVPCLALHPSACTEPNEWVPITDLTLDLDHESEHRKLNPTWRFPT